MKNQSIPDTNSWQKGLKIATSCPLCGHDFKKVEARVIEEQNDSRLLYFNCQKCQHAILNLVFSHQMGIGSLSLVTDLNFDEVLKFHGAKPIGVDSVLETHLLLQDPSCQRFFQK